MLIEHGLLSSELLLAAIHRSTASGPDLIEVLDLGGLEQIADRHVDTLAWRRLSHTPQKLFKEQLLSPLFGQAGHEASPSFAVPQAPPRLCDPPCAETQAGIGSISQTPELLTIIKGYDGKHDCATPAPTW
jgi:hypothetical protein